MSMPYSSKVMEYFRERDRVGTIPAGAYPVLGVGKSGSISNGEVVVMYLAADAEKKLICVRYQVQGSVATMAACAFSAQYLEGQQSDKASEALTAALISDTLSLPRTKQHCAFLVEDAVHSAIVNLKNEE